MSYFPEFKISGYSAESEMAADAFGRQRTSHPMTILENKSITPTYDALFWNDAETSGMGTSSVFNTDQASYQIRVSAATAGKRTRQTKLRANYQTGKSQLILATVLFRETSQGVSKRVGYFDSKNGLYFENREQVLGQSLSFHVRTYTSGVVGGYSIQQSEFNVDTLDGTGQSGYNFTPAKTTIFFIDFEWLGSGQIRFGVVDSGRFIIAGKISNSQILDETAPVYMSNPNLPISYEIEANGASLQTTDSMFCICSTVISEGGQDITAVRRSIDRNGIPKTLANQDIYTPVLSVRLKSKSNTGTAPDYEVLNARVLIEKVSMLVTSTTNYSWRLILNPTIAGPDAASWVNVENSALQYDTSRTAANAVTGGTVIDFDYGASTSNTKGLISTQIKSHLTLGFDIANISDEIILAIANIDGNAGTAYAGITFTEYV